MQMIKYHFVIDKTKKNETLKKIFLKKYKNYNPKASNIIIVLGGDGFMLKILKKYQTFKKPFYGINTGSFGFLMNKFKSYNIDKNIFNAKSVSISPLVMKALTKKNKTISVIAINEISLLRQTRQTASLQIFNGNKIIIKKLISDGVLISTPAGSTAYNSSVNGPILSLNSKKLAITPISPFRPRRWPGTIVPYQSTIKVKNLNIKSVKIKLNNKIKFQLLYDKNNSLTKKIKLEQNIRK